MTGQEQELPVVRKLVELAERVEAERATPADEFRIISEAALSIFGWEDERYKRVLRLLEAGASLDAAMRLVPEGWEPVIDCVNQDQRLAHVDLWQSVTKLGGDGLPFNERAVGNATTPALALTAACLKARAEMHNAG
jgi:hypothetical protein